MVKLSVCAIVKNESKRIRKYMEAVSQYADEIIIVDNQSTDDTIQILKEYDCKVFSSSEKFDLARNTYLENATGDWILTLDIDERLEPERVDYMKRELEMMDSNVYGIILPILSYFGHGWWCQWNLVRILRNGNYHIGQAFHASLDDLAVENGGILKSVYAPIHHYDALWNINQISKRKRNEKYILKNIAEDPGLYKHFADEYYAIGKKEKAIEIGKLGLLMDKRSHSRVYKSLANYYFDLQKYNESIQMAERQIELFKKEINDDEARKERCMLEISACYTIQYKCMYNLGQVEQAVVLCRKNMIQYPLIPHNYLNLYLMTGNREYLETAALLNPEIKRNQEIFKTETKNSLYGFASSVIKKDYEMEIK